MSERMEQFSTWAQAWRQQHPHRAAVTDQVQEWAQQLNEIANRFDRLRYSAELDTRDAALHFVYLIGTLVARDLEPLVGMLDVMERAFSKMPPPPSMEWKHAVAEYEPTDPDQR